MAYTFTTLKTAIQDYVQSTESTFVSQLPRFILNAEERILLGLYNQRFQESLQWLKNLGEGLQTRDQYRYDRVRREVA
jgi:hypothetical protein